MNNSAINLDTGTVDGSFKSYMIGLVLSIVLTVVAFAIVMMGDLGRTAVITLISVFAVVQVLIQLVLFLHMGSSREWWNRTALIFSLILIAILVGGSLWVMFHLHHNMMP